MNILEEIVKKKKKRIEKLKEQFSLDVLKQKALALAIRSETKTSFFSALAKKEISFICEVKKASPSKGIITENFDYLKIAKDYELAGADAISVLTEEDYFLGSNKYLEEIAKNVSIPILRKDFIVDEIQIYGSKIISASAILLICSILDEKKLKNFIKIAESLKLDVLVEAHDEAEIKIAINAGAKIIGVNNRNLKDFSIDINHSIDLRKLVPLEKLFVSESGIKTAFDIQRLAGNNVNAVLIGESIMRAKNKKEFLKELKQGI